MTSEYSEPWGFVTTWRALGLGAAWGWQFRAAPLGLARGTGSPGADALASCCPAETSTTVEDLRHAIITNLEQSQDNWPPACPPLEPAR